MVAFSSARRALECAIAIQQALVAHNKEHPDEPISVRIGLHTGEAIREASDFLGKSVILAACIASPAVGSEILVSPLLKARGEQRGVRVRFAPTCSAGRGVESRQGRRRRL